MPSESVRDFCSTHFEFISRQRKMQMYLQMFANAGFAKETFEGYVVRRVFSSTLPKKVKRSKELTWIVRSSRRGDYIRIEENRYQTHDFCFDYPDKHPMRAPSDHLKRLIVTNNLLAIDARRYISRIKEEYPDAGVYDRDVIVLRNPLADDMYKEIKQRKLRYQFQKTNIVMYEDFYSPISKVGEDY